MSFRTRLYARLAGRGRQDLVARFSGAPPAPPADRIDLVPAVHAWGGGGELMAAHELPASIVSGSERFKVALLAFLQRWLPNDQRLSRWDRPTAERELLDVIGRQTATEGWPDGGSDAAWARLFVMGPLAGHLQRDGDELVLDCTGMRGLEPHPGLVRLGCRAAVTMGTTGPAPAWVELEDGSRARPGEAGWERAKLVFACAMQTWTVIVAHLLHVHYLTTGAVAAAAQRDLPWAHPIRRLLEPHLAGTLLVNWRANRNLLGRNGAVQSAYTYPYEPLMELFGRGVRAFDPSLYDLPASLRARGLDDLVRAGQYPFAEDALLVWDALERYVRRYVGLYYRSDADVQGDAALSAFSRTHASATVGARPIDTVEGLVGLVVRHAHVASVVHKQVGGIAWDFMTMPWFMPHRLHDAPDVAGMLPYREESEANLVAKWSTTPTSWKLARDWSDWALDADGADAMRALRGDLERVGAQIDARNARRAVPYPYLHPDRLESSVAV